jgi:hypothetical protein
MSRKRRSFIRSSGTRAYRSVYIIATEGKETEPQYFKMKLFQPSTTNIHIEILPTNNDPSPSNVLNRMKTRLKDYHSKEYVYSWLVVDKDSWKDTQLNQLAEWADEDKNRGLAVSNPQFEYWLLLHFEEADGKCSKEDCLDHLRRHLPEYSKSNLPLHKFSELNIDEAICRAYAKDAPPCEKWPETAGSTVYRLLANIRYSDNS